MAWKTVLKTYAVSQQATVWADFCAHIVDCGWTLHDAVSASKNVYYSQGESGTRTKEYIEVNYDATYVYATCYLFWNSATHVGYGGQYISIWARCYANTAGVKRFFGNKNLVGMSVLDASYPYILISGHWGADRIISEYAEAVLTAGVAAGANKIIAVDNTLLFRPNMPSTIIDETTGIREDVTITDVNAGVSVTATLANAYTSGSKIGACPSIFGCGSNNGNNAPHNIRTTCGLASGSGTAPSGTLANSSAVYAPLFPGTANSLYSLSPIQFTPYKTIPLGIENHIRTCTAVRNSILAVNNNQQYNVLTASSGAAAALNDTSQAWTIDEHIGKSVVIVANTGVDQSRVIISNTETRLVVRDNWTINPALGSNYIVADKTYYVGYANYAFLENPEA